MHSSTDEFTDEFLEEEMVNAGLGLSWGVSSESEQKILNSFNYANLFKCGYEIRADEQAWFYHYATRNPDSREYYCNFMTGRWKRLDLRVYGKVIVKGKVVA